MIRFINKEDKDACSKMIEEFYQTDAVDHNIPKEYITHTIEMALSEEPYNKLIVCLHGNKYAGYCHLVFTYSCEVGGLVAIIEEIYIKKDFRGKGLGKDIFNFIHKEFDDKIKRYRLEVVEGNKEAIKLYKKLGFKELPYKQMVHDL